MPSEWFIAASVGFPRRFMKKSSVGVEKISFLSHIFCLENHQKRTKILCKFTREILRSLHSLIMTFKCSAIFRANEHNNE